MCVFIFLHLLASAAYVLSGKIILEKNDAMEHWFPLTSVTTVGLVRSPTECGLHCLRVGWCQAMIYDVIDNVCNLSNRSSTVSESYWKPNTTYFQVQNGVPIGYNCDVFNGSCVAVMASTFSWNDAFDVCADQGAKLLKIDSAAKQSLTEQYMTDEGLVYAWLGLNDQTTEGHWTDPDGETQVYTNFQHGQPDNGGGSGQHCVLIRKDFGYKWDDINCDNSHYVICEMKIS